MVRLGRFWVILLLALGVLAGTSASTRAQEATIYRQALEAYDYGRWREAVLLFERSTEEASEGGRRDVQVYGQRWIPFLPHFFLGSSLFEIGRYEEALTQWRLSFGQLEAAPVGSPARNLVTYHQRRLRALAPVARLESEILSRELNWISRRLEAQARSLERLKQSTQVLRSVDRDSWRRTLDSYREKAQALENRRARLAVELGEAVSGGVDGDPLARLPAVVATASRTRALDRDMSGFERETGEARRRLTDQLVRHLTEGRARYTEDSGGFSQAQPGRHQSRVELAGWTRSDSSTAPPRSSEASCGYSQDDRTARFEALSDYLSATAIAESQGCREIQAIALPRLRCALAAWPARSLTSPDEVVAEPAIDYRPYRSLSLAAARCGDRTAARSFLHRHRSGRQGRSTSDPVAEAISLWLEGEVERFPGRSRALVIGAWDYSAWPDLPGARADFERLQASLTAQGFDVETLANPRRDDLNEMIERLSRTTRADDRVLLYYAGHGHLTRSEALDVEVGWIVPVDAPPGDSPQFAEFGVSMDEIREWSLFGLDRARQQLFVFDSCFAGQIFLAGDRSRRCGTETLAKQTEIDFPFLAAGGARPGTVGWLERQSTRIWMSAGSATQRVADESKYSALFADALDGREPKADANGDGYLLTDVELSPFLRARARAQLAQTPQSESLCGEGDFVFRLASAAAMPEISALTESCASDPLAVLEDVFRWEALARVDAFGEYAKTSRCSIFLPLAERELESAETF